MERYTAVEKRICEINEEDKRIRILGTVVDFQGNTIIVDDGTGKANVVFKEPVDLEIGEIVKIIGRVSKTQEKYLLIYGECIQKLNGFEVNLYRKAREILKKVMEDVQRAYNECKPS